MALLGFGSRTCNAVLKQPSARASMSRFCVSEMPAFPIWSCKVVEKAKHLLHFPGVAAQIVVALSQNLV
jgi:hypothetical protein